MATEIGLWTRYGERGASSRLRFFAYLPYLRAAGYEPRVHAFFSDVYLKKLYAEGGKSKGEFLRALGARFVQMPQLEKMLLIEYELLPFFPAGVELSLLYGRRYFLNFDDAVWCKYGKLPLLRGKYERLAAGAAGVIVANEALKNHLAPYNSRILSLPTAIPIPARPSGLPQFSRFTIGWIGTPVTYRYLQHLAAALRTMSQKTGCRFLIIAGKDLPPIPGVEMEFVDWSEENASLLERCHAGIMPLDDDEFSRGKSAFKLIQYLASGLPAIASPVGENCNVLRDGVTGFFATTPESWGEAALQLQDPATRERLSANARQEALRYDLGRNAEKLLRFLQEDGDF